MAFLSLLDDRAKPKGSRDPLGFEMVWTHYGRRVIGNLTTITSSLGNFATALLGFKWANELYAHLPERERYIRIQESFLRYEQLAGYLRHLGHDNEVMGITRVRRRLEDDSAPLTFGLGADQQILSDQASYGLWGLYSTALRDTRLITGEDRLPTDLGLQIAHDIEKHLNSQAVIDIFMSDKKVRQADLAPFARSFVRAIDNKTVREQLLHALLQGNRDHELQAEVWRVTQTIARSNLRNMDLSRFVREVKRRTKNQKLIDCLTDIERAERVLVAANNVFHYCRRKDGESLSNIIETLTDRYSYTHLPDELDVALVPRGESLIGILDALRRNDQKKVIDLTLALNRAVMEQRGGAPWVEIEGGNTLRVRVKSELSELKSQIYLQQGWDYDYFIDSYIRIANDGLGAQWRL